MKLFSSLPTLAPSPQHPIIIIIIIIINATLTSVQSFKSKQTNKGRWAECRFHVEQCRLYSTCLLSDEAHRGGSYTQSRYGGCCWRTDSSQCPFLTKRVAARLRRKHWDAVRPGGRGVLYTDCNWRITV